MEADLYQNLVLVTYDKMARRYSRKKGKSGSKRPTILVSKEWANKDIKAVKDVILELSKEGKTTSQIGAVLRDSYAVPSVKGLMSMGVSDILKEAGIKREVPEDLLALIRRDIALAKHFETNKHDMTAKRGQQLTISKINRLVKYYKETKVLPSDWTYNREKAVQWIV